MRPQLDEVVLLSCRFQFTPVDRSESETTEPADDEDLLQLRHAAEEDEDGVTLFLQAILDDERLDFDLEIDLAAHFIIPSGQRPPLDELRPTLIFMAFPYLRQIVSDMTERSPVPAYYLRALTLPPKPDDSRVMGEG